MPEQPSTAFISYSRDDSEFALRLATDLKAAGAAVWLDQLDISPGDAWDNAVEDALIAASRMLLILTPESSRSKNVRNEISFALEQGKVVIPVLYRDCIVPLQLQRNNRVDFRADYARGLGLLLANLQITHPDPAVLAQAAELDAQRKAAWQAREVTAERLQQRQDQLDEQPSPPPGQPPPPPPPPPLDAEAQFQRMREEKLRQQRTEAAAREAELVRQAQVAQAGAAFRPPLMPYAAAAPPPAYAPAPPAARTPPWYSRPAVLAFAGGTLALIVIFIILIAHMADDNSSATSAAPPAPVVSAPPAQPSADSHELYQQGFKLFNARDYAAALPLLDQSCTGGDPEGCFTVGDMYDNKLGVAQDYTRARTYYIKGCNGGSMSACSNLALLYRSAHGVPQDYTKAHDLYARACKGGLAAGCHQLGMLYAQAVGVPQDYARAITLYQQSCNAGSTAACSDLANLYHLGTGVPRNFTTEKVWRQKACKLGSASDCEALKTL